MNVKGIGPKGSTCSCILAKNRVWYENDPLNTENQLFLLTNTYNTLCHYATFCFEPEDPIWQMRPIRSIFTKDKCLFCSFA